VYVDLLAWFLVFQFLMFVLVLNLQMRLNKVSELIHNSTNHQNLDSAGVSVHFQEIIDLVTWVLIVSKYWLSSSCL
jgi:hypothetical protein